MTVSRSQFQLAKVPDPSADTSYLGQYGDNPGPDAIDRRERSAFRAGEFRYFNTANADAADDLYRRVEGLNRGDWSVIGIQAAVELQIPIHAGVTVTHAVRSPGRWVVESDTDADYLADIYAEECETLATMLSAMGVVVDAG